MTQKNNDQRLHFIQSIGRRFKHDMIMTKPSSVELKANLMEMMELLTTPAEQTRFLSYVKNTIIECDVYYKSSIQTVLSFVEDKLSSLDLLEKANDHLGKPVPSRVNQRTINEIALQYVWEGKIIDNQNKHDIAKKLTSTGMITLKNGNKLYNQFSYFSQKCNRIGDRGSDKKNINHLKEMVKTLPYLKNRNQRESAEIEINTFSKNTGLTGDLIS